jgi:hypothetical protein
MKKKLRPKSRDTISLTWLLWYLKVNLSMYCGEAQEFLQKTFCIECTTLLRKVCAAQESFKEQIFPLSFLTLNCYNLRFLEAIFSLVNTVSQRQKNIFKLLPVQSFSYYNLCHK